MNASETLQALHLAAQFDPAILPRSDEDRLSKAVAWNAALDVRIDLDTAGRIITDLASGGAPVTPGTINERFLSTIRDGLPGQKARPHLPRPVTEQRPERPALPPVGKPAQPSQAYIDSRRSLGHRIMNDPVFGVQCPWCGAEPRTPCTVVGRPMRHADYHPARAEAHRKATV